MVSPGTITRHYLAILRAQELGGRGTQIGTDGNRIRCVMVARSLQLRKDRASEVLERLEKSLSNLGNSYSV